MKKREVRNQAYQALKQVLSDREFVLKRSEEAFVRRIKSGQQRIYVPIIDYSPEYVLSIAIGIRLDEVETIFHKFSGSPEHYQDLSTTTITQLNYFTDGRIVKYTVHTADELDQALNELVSVINSRVLPLLDECTDVEKLYQLLNRGSQFDFDSTQLPPQGYA